MATEVGYALGGTLIDGRQPHHPQRIAPRFPVEQLRLWRMDGAGCRRHAGGQGAGRGGRGGRRQGRHRKGGTLLRGARTGMARTHPHRRLHLRHRRPVHRDRRAQWAWPHCFSSRSGPCFRSSWSAPACSTRSSPTSSPIPSSSSLSRTDWYAKAARDMKTGGSAAIGGFTARPGGA
ncbi:MAG: hypothetical protein MZW92_21825 [Comamonadaceae bacterium]|nr:hypothetical protein [Comamonadaceae bacterium]